MFGVDDAIFLGMGAVGLGMQIFGGQQQAEISKQSAALSKDVAYHEGNINDLKAQQMELEGRRSLLQTYRNTQRAVAMGVNSAVNQGAQFGSGMLGGMYDTQNQGAFNALGINQALTTGRAVNTENKSISQDKMQLATLQGKSAEAQGWTSLGGSLLKAGGPVGQMLGGFGNKSSNPYYGPLDYNG